MMEFQTQSFCLCSLLCNQLGVQNPKRNNDGTWNEFMYCKKYSKELQMLYGKIVIRCNNCIDENTIPTYHY